VIELVAESEGKLLGIKVRGRLTARDYVETFVPHLDWVFQQHGKARLLFAMEKGVEGLEDDSPWEPGRFAARHGGEVEKLAVAGEGQWGEWAQRTGGLLGGCEAKAFAPGQWEMAWDWITDT